VIHKAPVREVVGMFTIKVPNTSVNVSRATVTPSVRTVSDCTTITASLLNMLNNHRDKQRYFSL